MIKKVRVIFGIVWLCVAWFAWLSEAQEPYGGGLEEEVERELIFRERIRRLPCRLAGTRMWNRLRDNEFRSLSRLPGMVPGGGFLGGVGRLGSVVVWGQIGVSANVGRPSL